MEDDLRESPGEAWPEPDAAASGEPASKRPKGPEAEVESLFARISLALAKLEGGDIAAARAELAGARGERQSPPATEPQLAAPERPDFDAAQRSLYYARVLEIPTPRWVLYDKLRFDTEIPEESLLVGQERGCTSPIWYTPEG